MKVFAALMFGKKKQFCKIPKIKIISYFSRNTGHQQFKMPKQLRFAMCLQFQIEIVQTV